MNLRQSAVIVPLFVLTLALVLVGLVVLCSASASLLAKNPKGNMYVFLGRQLMWLAIGLGFLGLSTQFDYNRLRPWARLLLLLSIVLLAAVLWSPFGYSIRGATRWLRIGPVTFQPSELAKLSLILYLAESWSRRYEELDKFWPGIVPSFIVIGVVLGLIFPEPDKGTAFFLGMVCVVLWFIVNGKVRRIVPIAMILSAATLLLILKDPYSAARIRAYLHPEQDKTGRSYHIDQSKKAFANGGWFGLGIGEGRQKMGFIPESHSDFIFPVFAEELGFAGCVLMLGAFSAILSLAVYTALHCDDLFGSLLVAGCGLCIGLQAFLNIAVVTGCIPTTGISLPFISYGGSSLVVFMLMIGLIINVTRSTLSAGVSGAELRRARSRRRYRMRTAPA